MPSSVLPFVNDQRQSQNSWAGLFTNSLLPHPFLSFFHSLAHLTFSSPCHPFPLAARSSVIDNLAYFVRTCTSYLLLQRYTRSDLDISHQWTLPSSPLIPITVQGLNQLYDISEYRRRSPSPCIGHLHINPRTQTSNYSCSETTSSQASLLERH